MAGLDALIDAVDLEDYLEVNPDGTKTLRLAYPFEIQVNAGRGAEAQTVETLRLRRPKAREIDMIENARPGGQSKAFRGFARALIAEPAAIPEKYVEDMDAEDSLRLLAVAASFFPKLKSATGEAPPTS